MATFYLKENKSWFFYTLIMIYSPFFVFSSVHCSKLLSQGCSSGAPSVTDQTSPVHPPAIKREEKHKFIDKEKILLKQELTYSINQ